MLKQYVRGSSKRVRKIEIEDKESGERRTVRVVRGGHKIGLLLAALNEEGQIVIGHSKWNEKADYYDADLAKNVALDRLNSESTTTPALSLYRTYNKFVNRAERWFKDAELCVATRNAKHDLQIDINNQRERQLAINAEKKENSGQSAFVK